MKHTDLILSQLALANNVTLLSRGIPQTMAAFGWKYFLDDVGCKMVLYFHRVSRGVSLNATCLLSGFQAITICSQTSWWRLRTRFSKCLGFCGFSFWILQLLLNAYIPMQVTGPKSSQNTTVNMNFIYCSSLTPNRFLILLHAVIFSSVDLLCLCLMVWASGSMVFVLHRHRQRVQHIHSHRLILRSSREA
ncbi:vomeronasal type-1 receptor 1-like [Ctenodactylus gundi]